MFLPNEDTSSASKIGQSLNTSENTLTVSGSTAEATLANDQLASQPLEASFDPNSR